MSLDDIKSLKLKVRKDADRSDLDPAHQTMIRQWNKLDSALYDHFLKVHNQMVDQYGREKMAADLKQLEGSLFFSLFNSGRNKRIKYEWCMSRTSDVVKFSPVKGSSFSLICLRVDFWRLNILVLDGNSVLVSMNYGK